MAKKTRKQKKLAALRRTMRQETVAPERNTTPVEYAPARPTARPREDRADDANRRLVAHDLRKTLLLAAVIVGTQFGLMWYLR